MVPSSRSVRIVRENNVLLPKIPYLFVVCVDLTLSTRDLCLQMDSTKPMRLLEWNRLLLIDRGIVRLKQVISGRLTALIVLSVIVISFVFVPKTVIGDRRSLGIDVSSEGLTLRSRE